MTPEHAGTVERDDWFLQLGVDQVVKFVLPFEPFVGRTVARRALVEDGCCVFSATATARNVMFPRPIEPFDVWLFMLPESAPC